MAAPTCVRRPSHVLGNQLFTSSTIAHLVQTCAGYRKSLSLPSRLDQEGRVVRCNFDHGHAGENVQIGRSLRMDVA